MSRLRMRWLYAIAACCMAALTCFVGPQVAYADSGNPSYCDSDVDLITNQNFGTDIPVILVHGFSGSSTDWSVNGQSPKFYNLIDDIDGVSVAQAFSYTSFATFNVGGGKLAKTIDCVSQISTNNGGNGKVTIVAYSEGGLITRYALDQTASASYAAKISDEVGQVIDIAVPDNGVIADLNPAHIAMNDMIYYANLKSIPSSVIVHTIAGNVIRVHADPDDPMNDTYDDPHDDTLVPVYSAKDQTTYGLSYGGGGSTTITCYKYDSETANCEHGRMIQSAANGVREDTVAAIKAYLSPSTGPTFTVHSLSLQYDETKWSDAGYGVGGPDYDIEANDATNPGAFSQVLYYGDWCTDTTEECAIDTAYNTVVGSAPTITVGGHAPDYSARYDGYGESGGGNLVWCFSDEKICVYYRSPATAQLNPSQALLDLFSTAIWSS